MLYRTSERIIEQVAVNTNPAVKHLYRRANFPKYARVAAAAALILTVLVIAIAFFRASNRSEFRLKGEHARLSKDIVAEVSGYERLETEGDLRKYFIKADKAVTFADNHQELENVFLEVFDETGMLSDKMTASKALYIPEAEKNFTAYFAGNVKIETRDRLKVKTENITYTKSNETAEADEAVEFERDTVKGNAFGAIVKVADKKLELLRDVQITTYKSADTAASDVQEAQISAGYASVDQLNERIDLQNGMKVNIVSDDDPKNVDLEAGRGTVFFQRPEDGDIKLSKVELFDSVRIETSSDGGKPTKIDSGYASYSKDSDRFELKQGASIVTVQDERPVDIRSNEAIYEQAAGKIFLFGNAEITQLNDLVKGENITALLYASKKLRSAEAYGNAYLKQTAPERVSEITAAELNASFDEAQQLTAANALGQSTAVLTPAQSADYSKVTMISPNAVRVSFKGQGLLERIDTQGRTSIQLDAPSNSAGASNKRLTADTVKAFFDGSGRFMQKAEAVGNAELQIEPLTASVENYRTTVTAPRFDCDFFSAGNNAKQCTGGTKTKTIRIPTVAAQGRGTQTMTADRLNAFFSETTRNVERFEAVGDAKFSELDRNAIAAQFSFTSGDEVVRLRGGEPTLWDSKARAKAKEVDWDTRNQKSHLRGGVSTTYYSQKQTGGAAPFSDANKPVFLTADSAEIDHRAESAVYTGNARGWQENNYVRANRFLIQQREGQFFADGAVQSLLYDAKRVDNGVDRNVPVYAAASKMLYNRETRLLRYEENVDIRQDTDRITAKTANVFLNERNELAQTIAEDGVIITQPNRKATGDYAQYTAVDESVILRGSPARVEDGVNGSSQGAQMTVYLRDKRVIGEAKTKANTTGRIRSVYKVKNE